MLRDDIDAMGPVRLKEVDEAQNEMIGVAKNLADRGEIVLSSQGAGDEEMNSFIKQAR